MIHGESIQFHSTAPGTTARTLVVKQIEPIIEIKEVCHNVKDLFVDDCRKSEIFDKVIYHYSGSPAIANSEDRNFDYAASASNGQFYSRSLAPACYRDDFFIQPEHMFYEGTQLIANEINQPSMITALGNKPIVEVYEVNPNQIFYNRTPQQPGPGNRIDPGNITIR